jgi:DNA (cytosine-5)-methyltransferase 1
MKERMRVGSLCTGYGGLDMAVMEVFGGALAWCADNDRHAAKLLGARYPQVSNLGDITSLDWLAVPPVDVLCAGFPCQDISIAGQGAGITRGTRSGIWINIVEGIRILAPKIIVVENVAAIRRRGLDRVLGDLAALGYDAKWTSLRASDIGAAHRRERVFVLAHLPSAAGVLIAAYTRRQRWSRRPTRGDSPRWWPPSGYERSGDHTVSRRALAANSVGQRRNQGFRTPAEQSWCPAVAGDSRASDRHDGAAATKTGWGLYGPAICRWEAIIGRPAPYPTETGTRGQPRLSAAFSEWLMGIPAGFITDLGLPYYAQHQLIGNGVVPLQAATALRQLIRQTLNHDEHASLPLSVVPAGYQRDKE